MREAILGEIELWAKDPDRSSIFWLNGLAGELPTILRNVDLERIGRGEGVPGDWLCGSVRWGLSREG